MPTEERNRFLTILRECERVKSTRRRVAIQLGLAPDANLQDIAEALTPRSDDPCPSPCEISLKP